MMQGMMKGFLRHSLSGLLPGAATGAVTSLFSGSNVLTGAAYGALGGGVGAGIAGKFNFGQGNIRSTNIGAYSAAKRLPGAKAVKAWGAQFTNKAGRGIFGFMGNGRLGGGWVSANSSWSAGIKATTLAGIAGGMIGASGRKKSSSSVNTNNWSMGTAGPGYFNQGY